ncbi:MAG TPA: type I phosphomannose isomerase catalytic subunit [Spirochaetia bacterium]|nr:type I phosphomannose isomerase catalytic subunit [Spirochaetia bacterium]
MRVPVFKTEPVFQPRPWGSETWSVSAHPNGVCRVSGGPLEGTLLDELVRKAGPDLVGAHVHEKYGGMFPLLVKLIEVNSIASVQVHPNDEQARRLEAYPWGKTEAWYIIDRSPTARFFIGFTPGTDPAKLRAALASGTAASLLASPEVMPGDCLLVPPGTVHAVGDGVFLLEIQQSSDITYRVYDWDRRDKNGKPRELHVDKAVEVIDFSARPRICRAAPLQDAPGRILSCSLFTIDELRVSKECSLPARPSCSTGTIIKETAELVSEGARLELRRGDSFVVPAWTEARLVCAGPQAATAILTEIT